MQKSLTEKLKEWEEKSAAKQLAVGGKGSSSESDSEEPRGPRTYVVESQLRAEREKGQESEIRIQLNKLLEEGNVTSEELLETEIKSWLRWPNCAKRNTAVSI